MANLYDFNVERLRTGQKKAYRVLCDRVLAHEPYTAIVIPTRYGKSDLMRIGAVQLRKHGIVSAAFGLSPGIQLTGQLADQSKWIECIERYDLPRSAKHRTVEHPEDNYTPNDESFLCATLQLVVYHIEKFAATAARLKATGLPALFFIDECHFTSERNRWGEAAETLTKAGALVVLLTATAIRDDGYAPAGFRTERVVINENAKRVLPGKASTPDKVKMDVYAGAEIETRIMADHETTFGQAWEESPSPLCKVDHLPFDVYLSETDIPSEAIDGEDWIDARISTMNVSQVKQYLGRICRSQPVIKEGSARLVRLLSERRRIDDPRIAAIVFCDRDRNDNGDVEINRWAKSIRRAIEASPGGKGLNVVIATSTSEEDEGAKGNNLIDAFVKGAGDILIVKQMGGAGLDCSRIKIVLDLSPVRSVSSWVQRIMRAATPHNGHRTCALITPDDCLSRSCFKRMIESQGGGARFEGELIESYEVERQEREWLQIISTGDAPFRDNAGNTGEAEQYEDVRSIKEIFPELQLSITDAECARRAASLIDKIRNNKGRVANLTADIKEAHRRCDDAAHDVTMMRLNGVYDKERYGVIKSHVWHEAYGRAGAKPPLEEINDLKVLRNVEKVLIEMLGSAGAAA